MLRSNFFSGLSSAVVHSVDVKKLHASPGEHAAAEDCCNICLIIIKACGDVLSNLRHNVKHLELEFDACGEAGTAQDGR